MGRLAHRIAAAFAVMVVLASPLAAQEIGYVEDFALAKDRAEALKQLIPGTQEYYYYNCLHLLNTEQFDKIDDFMKPWVTRYGETAQVWQIRHRQALLTYDKNPQATLKYLQDRLGLQFNHQRETLGQNVNLPTSLDPKVISRATLTQYAMRFGDLNRFEDSALEWVAGMNLDELKLHHLLSRLSRPDIDNLPKLVVDNLHSKYNRGFGSHPIHRNLLLDQLEAVVKLDGGLLNDGNFVNIYLTKLQPASDVDWRNDPAEMTAYLDRIQAFASRLAPVHNSLKAHVLYHRLVFDRAHGDYNKERFMAYIQLPRNTGYVNREWMKQEDNRRFAVNFNAQYATDLAPVGNDEPLVRSYLEAFFINETATKPYEDYLDATYLKHVLAETKIVNGLGDQEQWYSMLPPAVYQALKERVDIDFAYTNKELFAPDEAVSVDLHVKNVKTLIVKVYEINATNYYRENLTEVDTDITLDGLVANDEQTFDYPEPPLRRVKRHFEFPKLSKRGVFVIDFIGNGRNSRLLVRKGKLHFIESTGPAGHVLTILDETNQQVKDATVRLGGHEYTPEKDGRIIVPYSTAPSVTPIVITRGEFSSLADFNHQAENYALTAGIYVDREALIQRQTAKVVIRPSLSLNGTPMTLSVLEDVKLTITSVDTDGVATTKEVNDFKLFEDRESVYEFSTPQRLTSIGFALTAKVQNLSQARKVDVGASEQFQLNQILPTEKVEDLHLMNVAGKWAIELLGRTGEPKANRSVRVSLKHRDFKEQVNVVLQTDAQGRVQLGDLPDITHVTAAGPEGTQHTWPLEGDRVTTASNIYGQAGESITIPYMSDAKQVQASELSLLEMRGGTFIANRINAIKVKNGFVQIDDLPHGEYSLFIKPSNTYVYLRFTEGPQREGYVMGSYQLLEERARQPLQITSVDAGKDTIKVQLANATKFARVHVLATRYEPAYDVFAHISQVRDPEPYSLITPRPRSAYMPGREIGDEFRYILDRKYAEKFPGNMLKRPQMLLNPWAIRDTQTGQQDSGFGEGFGGAGKERGGVAARPAMTPPPAPPSGDFANLDFLTEGTALLLNLQPDKAGVVEIDRKALGAHQQVHIVAVDPRSTVYRSVSLPGVDTDFNDLRLTSGLPVDKHFTEQKQVTVVGKDDKFVMDDITSGKFEAYDNLARVYGLYSTLSGDSNLREFGFILNWPKLKEEEKREMYSKYACHELNFFIYKKDPKFFAAVVKPYIANKKDKTFMDHWLVGADLKPYLEPWAFNRLNIVERALLAQRIDGELSHTARHVTDLYNLIPPDIERFNQLFGTALKGSALDTGDAWGVEKAKAESKPQANFRANNALAEDKAVTLESRLGLAGAAPAPAATAAPAAPGKPMEQAARQLEALKKSADAAPARDRAEADGRALRRGAMKDAKADSDELYERADEARKRVQQLYRKLDKTKEWVENNYYQLPIESQVASLVTVDGFWKDYASHDPTKPFYSTNLAEAARNFTEMMFAISVLDIPFEAGEHKTAFEKTRMTLTPGSYMVVYHKQIREANTPADGAATPILVNQNFFRRDDRYKMVENERVDKFVSDEFLIHTVYGCQVVVTNPTSARQKLDVLVQIPVGALPVLNGQYTKSVHIDLQPYNTQTIEYYFYFPVPGNYQHYPVHVAKNEEAIAFTKPMTLKVVKELSQIDKNSWQWISQHGSNDDVVNYLKTNNVEALDLEKVAWRMGDKAFFEQIVKLLDQRHDYHNTLWSYGIKHNVAPAIRQYLQHSDGFVAQCGDYLQSTLLTIDPVARHMYQHMEYEPLVNARAHQLSQRRRIVNDRFHQQYHRLMNVLSYKRSLDDDDLLAISYYMLLQDRVDEAASYFNRVNPANVPTRIQYDYMAAYLDMYSDDPKIAQGIVDKYADYPVDKWRNLYSAVSNQLKEIAAGANAVNVADKEDRTQAQTALAAAQPSFDVRVEAKQITIDYQNLKDVTLNFYLMDIEMLFSRNPFVQQVSGAFSYVRPNLTQELKLPAGKPSVTLPLPAQFLNRNVLVEVVGAGDSKAVPYYSHSLAVQMIENYGQVRVTNSVTSKPIPKAYVKVYALMNNGEVKFYKDGYTDLRGRFDYTSLSTNELDYVQKFSVLILSDEHGAVVREAAPPKR